MVVRVPTLEIDEPGALLERGVALLDGLAADPTPVLRWYRCTSRAVVLGRGQRRLASELDVPVFTRFSGGGAVLLGPDLLSLDIAVPTGHPLLDGPPAAAFRPVGEGWASALRGLGVVGVRVHDGPPTARRRGSQRERLLADVCFATLGTGEVLVAGRKLVGLAQRRRRPGALVQCGLLLRWRPGELLAALGAEPDDEEIADAAVGLSDLDPPVPHVDDVVATVTATLRERLEDR